jgi:hypothetical protein
MIGIGANIEDKHIEEAIAAQRRWVELSQEIPEGMLCRIMAYIGPLPGGQRPITGEGPQGELIHEALLEVQYFVPRDKPDEAHVLYAYEADERGFWEYG